VVDDVGITDLALISGISRSARMQARAKKLMNPSFTPWRSSNSFL
jgi:hypothetical protein